jgi:hypothetical protein
VCVRALYTHTHIRIYTYIYVYIHTYTCIYIHVYVCIPTYVCMYIDTHIHAIWHHSSYRRVPRAHCHAAPLSGIAKQTLPPLKKMTWTHASLMVHLKKKSISTKPTIKIENRFHHFVRRHKSFKTRSHLTYLSRVLSGFSHSIF